MRPARAAPTTVAEVDPAGLVFDVAGSIGVTALDPADDVRRRIRDADIALRAAKAGRARAASDVRRRRDSARRPAHQAGARPARRRSRRAVPRGLPADRRADRAARHRRRGAGPLGRTRSWARAAGRVHPVAEETGLIVHAARWVLREATAGLAGLLAAGIAAAAGRQRSVRQLRPAAWPPDVAQALAAAGRARRSC